MLARSDSLLALLLDMTVVPRSLGLYIFMSLLTVPIFG